MHHRLRSVLLAFALALIAGLGVSAAPASATETIVRTILQDFDNPGLPTDGTIKTYRAGGIQAVAFDGKDVLVHDYRLGVITRVSPDGTVRTVGPITGNTYDLATDPQGNLYALERETRTVWRYAAGVTGAPTRFAGGNGSGRPIPGPATASPFGDPRSIATDAAGNVFVADDVSNQVVKITPAGVLSVIAGNGTGPAGNPPGGQATSGALPHPAGVAVDGSNNVYIAGSGGYLARVNPAGTLSVLIPVGQYFPSDLAVDVVGNAYFVDQARVVKRSTSGAVGTVLGSTTRGTGPYGDQPALARRFLQLNKLTVDPADGTLFVAGDRELYISRVFAPSALRIDLPTGETSTTADSVTFRVAFSEPVFGVDAADFAVTTTGTAAGTVASVASADDEDFVVTVNAVKGTGKLRLDLKSAGTGIADRLGTPEGRTDLFGDVVGRGRLGDESYDIDNDGPKVESMTRLDDDPTASASVRFRVRFDEEVAGVTAASFAVTRTGTANATVTAVAPSDGGYDVTVGGLTGKGTLRLDVKSAGSGIVDAFGQVSPGFQGGPIYTVDRTPPAVVSVTPVGPREPSRLDSIAFDVVFNKPMEIADEDAFSLVRPGDPTDQARSGYGVTGSGTTFRIVFYAFRDGELRLRANASADALTDIGGTALRTAFVSSTGFSVDQSGPIASIAPVDPVPVSNAASRSFTVTFDEPAEAHRPDSAFAVVADGVDVQSVTTVQTSPTTWTVTFGGLGGTGSVRLKVPDFEWFDRFDNGNDGDVVSTPVAIDRDAPAAPSITPVGETSGTLKTATFEVLFEEDLTGVDVADFAAVTTGSVAAPISGVTGSGRSYRVTLGPITGTGTIDLELKGAGVADGVGNVATDATSASGFTIVAPPVDNGGGGGAPGGGGVPGGAPGGGGSTPDGGAPGGGSGGGDSSSPGGSTGDAAPAPAPIPTPTPAPTPTSTPGAGPTQGPTSPLSATAACTSKVGVTSNGAAKGAASLTLTWPAKPAGPCTVKVSLTVKAKGKGKKPTSVGSSTLTLGKATSETVTVKLNAAGKKLLASKAKKINAQLTITVVGKTTATQALTIRAAKRAKAGE